MRANVSPRSMAGIVTYGGLRGAVPHADPAERLWVYGRGGRQCRRCGTRIERRATGPHVRSTYWCPSCQPSRAGGRPVEGAPIP